MLAEKHLIHEVRQGFVVGGVSNPVTPRVYKAEKGNNFNSEKYK